MNIMDSKRDHMDEKPMIIINEKPNDTPEQHESDTPVMFIETDDDGDTSAPQHASHRLWPWITGTIIATALLCMLMSLAYRYYRTSVSIGVPISTTSRENIAKLQATANAVSPEVVMTSDSVLGVGLNFYELRGLQACISLSRPDTTQRDVYLYCRSSDFTSYDPEDNRYIGSLVVQGKEMSSDVCRLGYCAMANGNVVIGVARDERVKDYCQQHGGSFFRQFIVVSDGVLPSTFYLHGKVQRRALGRIGHSLYLVESRNSETMWSFADALREYGFIDAIYITGGTEYGFYRTADGRWHGIGDASTLNDTRKQQDIVPWLVFKRR